MSAMTECLLAWMDSLPSTEFPTDADRSVFVKIRDRLAGSENLEDELRTLYRVEQFAEFALAMMWVSNDPEKTQLSDEEQSFLFQRFLQGSAQSAGVIEAAAEPEQEISTPTPLIEEERAQGIESASSSEPGDVSLPGFAARFEGFVEAMQAGDEGRVSLVSEIGKLANQLRLLSGPDDVEVGQFCELLVDFLGYIEREQLMDDVRVMNILSNISGDAAAWLQPDIEKRKAAMAEAVSILQDFRSLFE
ncbi:MAG: hypothetical protein FJ215_02320 [Ignavibacteria bacterium]|nr:hypothetical protein [Ignavibacteria bacterium]